jgi:integrase
MSVYRRGRFYHYEFQLENKTYAGSTKQTEYREARAVERQKRKEAAEGIARATLERDTVGTVFARYWKAHGRHLSWGPTLRKHMLGLEAFFGPDTPFVDLTKARLSEALEDYAATEGRKNRGGKTTRAGRPSNSTVNRRLAVFRAIYMKARDEWDVPVSNIVFKVHARKEPKERVRHCTVAQAKTILENLPERAQLVVGFVLATGCRKNETSTLEWPRVNFETMQAEVQTKGGGTRFVDLNAAALNVLARCTKPKPDDPCQLVFDTTNLRKDWEAAVKAAGLTDFRFHDLRHTAATWVGRAGADITSVMRMLGHSRVETTMKYRHVLREDVKRDVARLPTLIEGKVEPIARRDADEA